MKRLAIPSIQAATIARCLANGYSHDDLALATGLTVIEIDTTESGGPANRGDLIWRVLNLGWARCEWDASVCGRRHAREADADLCARCPWNVGMFIFCLSMRMNELREQDRLWNVPAYHLVILSGWFLMRKGEGGNRHEELV